MSRGGEPLYRAVMHDTTAYLCYTLLVAALGPLQFGFHLVHGFDFNRCIVADATQAELNGPQDVITCKKQSVTSAAVHPNLPQCISMSTDQFAIVSSIYTLGGLLGALSAGPCCNKLGRLNTIRLTTLFHGIGPIFECFAPNISLLCFGRVVSGIGSGASVVVVPIYISEVSPSKVKGLFGALTQIMINLGILLAQLLGYFLSRDSLWRIILAIAGVIGFAQLFGLLFVPESPKWLAEHHNPQRGRDILRRLRGHTADLDEEVKAWNIDSSNEDIGIPLCNKRLNH